MAKSIGLAALEDAMARVQDKFGQETVNIALDVTLKVGMRREKLQSIMLSDHFINYTMSAETLDGHMEFLNCPIFGSHKYAQEKYGVNPASVQRFSALISVLPTPKQCWTRFFLFHSRFGNLNAWRQTATANIT